MKSVWVEITLPKEEIHNILLLRSDDPKLNQQNKIYDYYYMWHGRGEGRREQDTN